MLRRAIGRGQPDLLELRSWQGQLLVSYQFPFLSCYFKEVHVEPHPK
jgi:hypothetical protein